MFLLYIFVYDVKLNFECSSKFSGMVLLYSTFYFGFCSIHVDHSVILKYYATKYTTSVQKDQPYFIYQTCCDYTRTLFTLLIL